MQGIEGARRLSLTSVLDDELDWAAYLHCDPISRAESMFRTDWAVPRVYE